VGCRRALQLALSVLPSPIVHPAFACVGYGVEVPPSLVRAPQNAHSAARGTAKPASPSCPPAWSWFGAGARASLLFSAGGAGVATVDRIGHACSPRSRSPTVARRWARRRAAAASCWWWVRGGVLPPVGPQAVVFTGMDKFPRFRGYLADGQGVVRFLPGEDVGGDALGGAPGTSSPSAAPRPGNVTSGRPDLPAFRGHRRRSGA